MKILVNLVIGMILFLLASVIFQVEVNPIVLDESMPEYMNVFVTLFLSAVVSMVIALIELILMIIMLTIIVSIMVHVFDLSEDGITAVSYITAFSIAIFGHPFVIDQWVQPNIAWFPNFTYWQFFAIFIVSSVINVSQTTNNKSK
jgi:hypothetical protein